MLLNNIKRIISKTPASLGSRLAFIPFKYRLGNAYTLHKKNIDCLKSKNQIFFELKKLILFAEKEIPFYQEHYQSVGFNSSQISSFEDISKIPIIKKKDLQKFNFGERVSNQNKGTITNTGGTSGQPLKLLLDGQAHAREWAHMHTIWEQLDYQTNSIKLTIRGMNLGDTPLNYNFIHNEFQVNAYCDFGVLIKVLDKTLSKYKIEYLHGYPSGIYEFIKQLDEVYPDVLKKLKQHLKGVFFGSEYPAPIYRDFIENKISVPTVSWYGHTEMAILAPEKVEPYIYFPFQSYGFTEAVNIDEHTHLVGTTIHNKLGPLIRYDTGDLIEPVSYKNGLLESFKVAEGRVGEFVTDLNGRNISLTALIFGRHHKIFETADFVQVKQIIEGHLTVFVTTQDNRLDCAPLFDSNGINMNIEFKIVSKPFKTQAGKVSLLVKE